MNRQPVKSSNLKSVGFENGTLEVEFGNGSIWQYQGVPAEVYNAMLAADSVGSYFAKNVRGTYESVRVERQA